MYVDSSTATTQALSLIPIQIVHNEFPMPQIPLQAGLPSSIMSPVLFAKPEESINDESTETKTETETRSPRAAGLDETPEHQSDLAQDTPMSDEPRGIKRDGDAASQSPPTSRMKPPAPTNLDAPPGSLPPQLLTLLQTIQSTLRSSFPTAPPHTAQRLAELILRPKQHYRTLPSYLRALDRIVSVASPCTVFPLPYHIPASNGQMMNGTSTPPDSTDRDSLGGAELTEIPWLRAATGSPTPTTNGNTSDLRTESTSLIDGPNGAGSIETVTVSVNGVPSAVTGSSPTDANAASSHSQPGISQGELLRQEQEAGIVTVPSPVPNGRVTRSSAAASAAANRAVGAAPPLSGEAGDVLADSAMEPEETVHVRGPNVIGMEDMGPQAPGSGLEVGLNVEGALGRRGEGGSFPHVVGREEGNMEDVEKQEVEQKDTDSDTVVVDADGVAGSEGGGKDGVGLENGPDAVDSSAL